MKADFPLYRQSLGAMVALFSVAAFAQSSGTSETAIGWIVKPKISLTETLTDNANINPGSGKTSDLITQIAPGIEVVANTARLKGYLDFGVNGLFYADQSDSSRTLYNLNAFGTYEAVEKWMFVDFSGVIAQQAISAFGSQSPSYGTINSNQTQTATYRISPYISGPLFGTVDYKLRYSLSTSLADASNASDVNLSQWSAQLGGSTPFEKLKWTVDGNQQTTDYSIGRKSDAVLLKATAIYSITSQFKGRLSTGWESNDYAAGGQESFTTFGYGFDWNPTERTQLSAFREKRFFGNGHNINFNHRFPMSSLSFTDTRDISILPQQFSTVGRGTYYNLYYQQCNQQFSNPQSPSYISDPTQLALFSDACANQLLAQTGVSANTPFTSGFSSSQATVARNQQLSWALFGARNSLTLIATRSQSQSAISAQIGIDSLTRSTLVKQKGLSVNFAHQLSAISNLNVLASRQESSGDTTITKTTTNLYQVSVSTKLGAKTTGSLSIRHSEFDSSTNPYSENALVGAVSFIY